MFTELWKAFIAAISPAPQKIVVPAAIDIYQNKDENLKAFGAMLRWSEGTSQIPNSDDGYRALVGGGTFDSYACHPHKEVWIERIKANSSAAGGYQIEYGQWAPYIGRLGLKDFSPQFQDIWMINALREVNALDDVYAGRFPEAVQKAGNRWASLPGSKFGQSIRTLAEVKDVYSKAGGQFAV